MPEKIGVENLKKIVLLMADVAKVSLKVAAGSGVTRWANLMLLGDDIGTLLSVQFKLLDDEWKDLSDAERGEMKLAFQEKFQCDEAKAEVLIEEAFGLLVDLGGLQQKIVSFVDKVKA